MSEDQGYPPPGAPQPPGRHQPSWPPPGPQEPVPTGQVPPGQGAPAQAHRPPHPPTGMLGAAHKPGAIPLRPLGLGDIYDGAFRIIRFNPKSTVGAAVLVAGVAMTVPVLVTAVLTFTAGLAVDETGQLQGYGEAASMISLFGGIALTQVAMVFVTGMIAHVAAAAAVGRRLGLGEAWAATRGHRWRLVGLTLLLNAGVLAYALAYGLLWVPVALTREPIALVLFGLATVPLFLVGLCWYWIRLYYLAAPALMLERIGVLAAVRRTFQLTRRQFWRTFGIALLTVIAASIAAQMFSFGFGLLGGIATVLVPESQMLALVVAQALSVVVAAAVTTPFTGTVASLQYLDQRIRKEAYDVELMTQAGITAR